MLSDMFNAPATIWLAAHLPGAGKRPSKVLHEAGSGGDNDTEPGYSVGGASASSAPPQMLVGASASSARRVRRRPASVLPASGQSPNLAHVARSTMRKRPAAATPRAFMWMRSYRNLRAWLQSHDGVYPVQGARSPQEKKTGKVYSSCPDAVL